MIWKVVGTRIAVVQISGVSMELVYARIIDEENYNGKRYYQNQLKAYDHRLIDQAAKKIVESVIKTGATVQVKFHYQQRKKFHDSKITTREQRLS